MFVVIVTDGIKARTGAVTVSTIVFAGLWAAYLCPVIIPELNVYVSCGLEKIALRDYKVTLRVKIYDLWWRQRDRFSSFSSDATDQCCYSWNGVEGYKSFVYFAMFKISQMYSFIRGNWRDLKSQSYICRVVR